MICEIINPSDPYTLVTDDFVSAAIGVVLIGGGQIGLECKDPPLSTPILFGWEDWFKENGVDLKDDDLIDSRWQAIADAMDSVLIGNVKDREKMEAILGAVPPDKRESERAKWHNKERSSMNDIGKVAWSYAKKLRKHFAKAKGDSA